MANVVEILVQGRDQFSPTASKVQQEARGVSGAMGGLGKTVLGVAGGFVAAQLSMAGVSKLMSSTIGAAAKFEAQLAQIRALTGATKEDTDFLTGAIRNMQKSVPKSSEELGSAAYFILSSGISDAAQAAEVLEIAAQASTVGLGETAVVADALTTVLNAYQLGAGEAGRVTDVLMQAVKDGKAEADAFAGVLGRVVPIAAEMGISFEEVTANMAAFTRLGVSAEEAATGLRGVMVQLLKPSQEAEELLAGVGLSASQLRGQIREKGLLASMQQLMERFKGNEEAISTLFPDVRGLTNFLATMGDTSATTADILGNMDTATGNLDRGFEEVSDTAQFKMQKAMNDLNVGLEELGAETLPLVAAGAVITADGLDILTEAMDRSEGKAASLRGEILQGLIPGLGGLARALNFEEEWNAEIERAKAWGATIAGVFGAGSTAADDVRDHLGELSVSLIDATKRARDTGTGFIDQFGLMEGAGQSFADEIETDIVPTIVRSFGEMRDEANDTRSALFAMFSEPTQEEAVAEAVLADYRVELARLEGQSRDLTTAESARADQLRDELIPTAEKDRDILRLERDAMEAHTRATHGALPSKDEWTKRTERQIDKLERLNELLRDIPKEVHSNVVVAIMTQQAAALKILGGVTAQQHGGVVRSALQLVGEQGPELAALPQGTRVFTASETRAMLAEARGSAPAPAQAAGGPTINLSVTFTGAILGDEVQAMQFARMLLPEIRRAIT